MQQRTLIAYTGCWPHHHTLAVLAVICPHSVVAGAGRVHDHAVPVSLPSMPFSLKTTARSCQGQLLCGRQQSRAAIGATLPCNARCALRCTRGHPDLLASHPSTRLRTSLWWVSRTRRGRAAALPALRPRTASHPARCTSRCPSAARCRQIIMNGYHRNCTWANRSPRHRTLLCCTSPS